MVRRSCGGWAHESPATFLLGSVGIGCPVPNRGWATSPESPLHGHNIMTTLCGLRHCPAQGVNVLRGGTFFNAHGWFSLDLCWLQVHELSITLGERHRLAVFLERFQRVRIAVIDLR